MYCCKNVEWWWAVFHNDRVTMLFWCVNEGLITWWQKDPEPSLSRGEISMSVWTGDLIYHLAEHVYIQHGALYLFSRCLWRLTLDSGGPGAVVENSQLSKHLPWPHGAELHALLRHLHLPIWNMDRNRGRLLVVMLFKLPIYFLAWLLKGARLFALLKMCSTQSFSEEMEWMRGVWGLLLHFWGNPARPLVTHWARKKKIILQCGFFKGHLPPTKAYKQYQHEQILLKA